MAGSQGQATARDQTAKHGAGARAKRRLSLRRRTALQALPVNATPQTGVYDSVQTAAENTVAPVTPAQAAGSAEGSGVGDDFVSPDLLRFRPQTSLASASAAPATCASASAAPTCLTCPVCAACFPAGADAALQTHVNRCLDHASAVSNMAGKQRKDADAPMPPLRIGTVSEDDSGGDADADADRDVRRADLGSASYACPTCQRDLSAASLQRRIAHLRHCRARAPAKQAQLPSTVHVPLSAMPHRGGEDEDEFQRDDRAAVPVSTRQLAQEHRKAMRQIRQRRLEEHFASSEETQVALALSSSLAPPAAAVSHATVDGTGRGRRRSRVASRLPQMPPRPPVSPQRIAMHLASTPKRHSPIETPRDSLWAKSTRFVPASPGGTVWLTNVLLGRADLASQQSQQPQQPRLDDLAESLGLDQPASSQQSSDRALRELLASVYPASDVTDTLCAECAPAYEAMVQQRRECIAQHDAALEQLRKEHAASLAAIHDRFVAALPRRESDAAAAVCDAVCDIDDDVDDVDADEDEDEAGDDGVGVDDVDADDGAVADVDAVVDADADLQGDALAHDITDAALQPAAADDVVAASVPLDASLVVEATACVPSPASSPPASPITETPRVASTVSLVLDTPCVQGEAVPRIADMSVVEDTAVAVSTQSLLAAISPPPPLASSFCASSSDDASAAVSPCSLHYSPAPAPAPVPTPASVSSLLDNSPSPAPSLSPLRSLPTNTAAAAQPEVIQLFSSPLAPLQQPQPVILSSSPGPHPLSQRSPVSPLLQPVRARASSVLSEASSPAPPLSSSPAPARRKRKRDRTPPPRQPSRPLLSSSPESVLLPHRRCAASPARADTVEASVKTDGTAAIVVASSVAEEAAVETSAETLAAPATQNSGGREDREQSLLRVIRSNVQLHRAILVSQLVDVRVLQRIAADAGVRVTLPNLISFLDSKGVAYR